MSTGTHVVFFVISTWLATAGLGQQTADGSAKYKALKCPPPPMGTTWTVLEHDGANREVDPYLSSLGQGEAGTGVIASPSFKLDTDTIRFTICGHDGQAGKRGENYIALIDARKGTASRRPRRPPTMRCRNALGKWLS